MYFYPRSPCGERQINCGLRPAHEHISIHALLAESDPHWAQRNIVTVISIHALLAESDGTTPNNLSVNSEFLSTLSLRRATVRLLQVDGSGQISIHALLAESDLVRYGIVSIAGTFLSTLSLRRATVSTFPCFHTVHISIHALLAESDRRS